MYIKSSFARIDFGIIRNVEGDYTCNILTILNCQLLTSSKANIDVSVTCKAIRDTYTIIKKRL